MKKKRPVIVQAVIRGLYYELALFVIYYISTGLDVLMESFRQGKAFYDLQFYFEMWFVFLVQFMFYCFMFFLPCMIGALCYVFISKNRKSNLLRDLLVHSFIYITGLSIVISITRTKIEFYSYDAIVYGLILLATILYWVVKRNKQKKIKSHVPPQYPQQLDKELPIGKY